MSTDIYFIVLHYIFSTRKHILSLLCFRFLHFKSHDELVSENRLSNPYLHFMFVVAYSTVSTNQLHCSYQFVQSGRMPRGGFSKDYVEHVGTVGDVDECVQHCCGSRDCDMAFMFANNCYRVNCKQNPKKCEPVDAKGRLRLVSKLVKIARRSFDGGEGEYDLDNFNSFCCIIIV